MSRDYTDSDANRDRQEILGKANDASFLRGRYLNLQAIIDNAQRCISGRGGPDDMDRYEEIQVAQGNLTLCQSLLSKL